MPPSQNVSRRPENIPPDEKSQYRWFKDTGFNGMHDFMLSCGLKPHNFEDYDEALQRIRLSGYRKVHDMQFEAVGM